MILLDSTHSYIEEQMAKWFVGSWCLICMYANKVLDEMRIDQVPYSNLWRELQQVLVGRPNISTVAEYGDDLSRSSFYSNLNPGKMHNIKTLNPG